MSTNNLSESSPTLVRFQGSGSPVVEVEIGVLRHIRELAICSAHEETGGILVGVNTGRDIRITDASDPGPNADRSRTHFLRDTEYCRKFLEAKYLQSRADYVGEWHSHVVALHKLSSGDLGTVAGIFVDPDYDFESFAIVLAVLRGPDAELLVYVAERRPGHGVRLIVTEIYRGPFPESETSPAQKIDTPTDSQS